MHTTRKRAADETAKADKKAKSNAGTLVAASDVVQPPLSSEQAESTSKTPITDEPKTGTPAFPPVPGQEHSPSHHLSPLSLAKTLPATAQKVQASTLVKMADGKMRSMISRVIVTVTAVDVLLSDTEREFFTDDIVTERVVPILNFTDIKTTRFAVGALPLAVQWGTEAMGPDLDRYLVHGANRATVWFLGVVTTTWLRPREGSRVNIGIKLLCKCDLDTARHLQYDLCVPAGDPSVAGQTVFFSRFLSSRAEEGGTFEEVYDAQDRLLAWGQMPQIDTERVQKTDLVLVECYVKRFRSRDRTNRRGWTNWGVNFDLLRIAVLAAGPGAPGDIAPDDCEVNL